MVVIDLGHQRMSYADTGCQLHSACLSCPFPDCYQGNPEAALRWRKEQRKREALAISRYAQVHGIPAAAQHYEVVASSATIGYTTRTIFRMLARAREQRYAP